MKILASLILATACGSAAFAQSIVANFDAPTFATGALVGQDGWVIGNGTAAPGFQSVTNQFSYAGGQSLAFDNSSIVALSSVRKAFAATTGASYSATTKLWIGANNNPSRLYGLYLSTSTFSGTYLAANIGGDGGIRVGKAWGDLYKNIPDVVAAPGTFADRWLDLTLTLNGTGGGSVSFSGFSDAAVYSYNFTGVANTTGTKYLLLGADYSGTTTVGVTGAAFYDNVALVTTSAVPEPATIAALGFGALALIKRRCRTN